jgi:hypothetical protein
MLPVPGRVVAAGGAFTFGQRLKEKGKKSIVVIGAIMTKLLHLIFGILRSGKPFNPSHLQSPEIA